MGQNADPSGEHEGDAGLRVLAQALAERRRGLQERPRQETGLQVNLQW